MSREVKLKITSWNCRGLNSITKLKQVMLRLQQLQCKIVFLQETHLRSEDIIRVRRRWPGQVFSASHSSHARGVIILIHKSIPFQMSEVKYDTVGRYVIIKGTLLSETLNLINVYGPNTDNAAFFTNLFLTISSLQGHYIMGGDFNCTLDPGKDRSSEVDRSHNQTRKVLKSFINDLNLIDIWRNQKPTDIQFSCYSSTHKTHSRIDYFLISAPLLSKIQDCWYDSMVLSDHASISLIYMDANLRSDPPNWRLHPKWLGNSKFIEYMEQQIDLYFDMNTSETSASTRWEAFKAFIRGQIISYTKTKSKLCNQKLNLLDSKLKDLEKRQFQNQINDTKIDQEILFLRAQYEEMSASRVASSMMKLKQSYYDQGEKPGKLLAWRIKQLQSESAINSIQEEGGDITTDPVKINNAFKDFFSSLYSSEYTEDRKQQETFLNEIKIPKISNEVKYNLEADLSEEEVLSAI